MFFWFLKCVKPTASFSFTFRWFLHPYVGKHFLMTYFAKMTTFKCFVGWGECQIFECKEVWYAEEIFLKSYKGTRQKSHSSSAKKPWSFRKHLLFAGVSGWILKSACLLPLLTTFPTHLRPHNTLLWISFTPSRNPQQPFTPLVLYWHAFEKACPKHEAWKAQSTTRPHKISHMLIG